MSWALLQQQQKKKSQAVINDSQTAVGATAPNVGSNVQHSTASGGDVHFKQLVADYNACKKVPIEQRYDSKLAMVENYSDYAHAWMNKHHTDAPKANPVIAYLAMIAADVQLYSQAIDYANYCEVSGTSGVYDRTPATMFCDAVLQDYQALKKKNKKTAADESEIDILALYVAEVAAKIDAGVWDINPPLHAKLHKQLGIDVMSDKPAAALAYFEKAQAIDGDNVGVKTRIKKLKKQLGND